jgi:hypothetical protein
VGFEARRVCIQKYVNRNLYKYMRRGENSAVVVFGLFLYNTKVIRVFSDFRIIVFVFVSMVLTYYYTFIHTFIYSSSSSIYI